MAMGNAPEKVKSSADLVAKPVSEQGLAFLIEDLLSKGRFAPLPGRPTDDTMTYKLLALDIDGTIHDRQTDTPLTERTKRAVARVLETGAGVTLATGRMYNSSLPFSRALGITLPIICYQGAFTSNPVTPRDRSRDPHPPTPRASAHSPPRRPRPESLRLRARPFLCT